MSPHFPSLCGSLAKSGAANADAWVSLQGNGFPDSFAMDGPRSKLLMHPNGQFLNGSLGLSPIVDDACLWHCAGDVWSNTQTGRTLRNAPATDPQRCRVEPCQSTPASPAHVRDEFLIAEGPPRPPSAYLEELQQTGLTVIDGVLGPAALGRFKAALAEQRAAHHADEGPHDGHFWITDGLAWSADVARAVTHPLVLGVVQGYLRTTAIHFCHQPIVTTLKPARDLKGTAPGGGWHTDYPYHPHRLPVCEWPAEEPLAVQCNICVDAFTAETGATQFVPGSHRRNAAVPEEFGMGGGRPGPDFQAAVRHMLAAAGAAVVYNARTWHRACPELNVSGADRVALLNAVAPAWVPPMMSKQKVGDAYRASGVPQELTEREAGDVARLCLAPALPAPPGAPAISG